MAGLGVSSTRALANSSASSWSPPSPSTHDVPAHVRWTTRWCRAPCSASSIRSSSTLRTMYPIAAFPRWLQAIAIVDPSPTASTASRPSCSRTALRGHPVRPLFLFVFGIGTLLIATPCSSGLCNSAPPGRRKKFPESASLLRNKTGRSIPVGGWAAFVPSGGKKDCAVSRQRCQPPSRRKSLPAHHKSLQ